MAIPSPAKILHLYRCIFFPYLAILTDEVERFPDLTSPLASDRVPQMNPSGSHLLPSSSAFLEYLYSISKEATATYTKLPRFLKNLLFQHLNGRVDGKASIL